MYVKEKKGRIFTPVVPQSELGLTLPVCRPSSALHFKNVRLRFDSNVIKDRDSRQFKHDFLAGERWDLAHYATVVKVRDHGILFVETPNQEDSHELDKTRIDTHPDDL
jgi:hypothetical protein